MEIVKIFFSTDAQIFDWSVFCSISSMGEIKSIYLFQWIEMLLCHRLYPINILAKLLTIHLLVMRTLNISQDSSLIHRSTKSTHKNIYISLRVANLSSVSVAPFSWYLRLFTFDFSVFAVKMKFHSFKNATIKYKLMFLLRLFSLVVIQNDFSQLNWTKWICNVIQFRTIFSSASFGSEAKSNQLLPIEGF